MAEFDTPIPKELRFFNLAVGSALLHIQRLFFESEMGIKNVDGVDVAVSKIARRTTLAMKSIGLLAKWLNIEGYMLYENERLDMWFHISMTPTYRGCLNTFSLLHDEPVQFFQPLQSAFHSNHDGAISLVKLIIEEVLRLAGVRNDPLRLLAGPEYPLDIQNNNVTEVQGQIEHGLKLTSGGEHDIVEYLHQIGLNWKLDTASTWEVLSVKLEKECLRAENESKPSESSQVFVSDRSPIIVHTDAYMVTLKSSGECFKVTEAQWQILQALSEVPGRVIAGPEFKEFHPELDGCRVDRVVGRLPNAIGALIERSPGRGYSLGIVSP